MRISRGVKMACDKSLRRMDLRRAQETRRADAQGECIGSMIFRKVIFRKAADVFSTPVLKRAKALGAAGPLGISNGDRHGNRRSHHGANDEWTGKPDAAESCG